MIRKRKRESPLDIIDIDRFTREVDYRDYENGCIYDEFKAPLKIASYLQTIYDGKGVETHSSSEELRRYEERIIESKCIKGRNKSGRKTSERTNRYRRGMRYPSDTKCGRSVDNLVHTKKRSSYSSGDTTNCEENRKVSKYLEEVKRIERRYEKLFKKQRNKISILTEMCQQCLEQCSKMSQHIEHNINDVKVKKTGDVKGSDRKFNGKHFEFHSVENEIKKACGDNVNCTDNRELIAAEKCYEKLAQKLEELKNYFDMKMSCDQFDNITCVLCKKRGIVSSEMLSGIAGKSNKVISIKKSDKAIATDFGNDGGNFYQDETVLPEPVQDPNYVEHPCIQNYFTNMYCSVILDNVTGMASRTKKQNAEERTDPDEHDNEEFGLRNEIWHKEAFKVLLAAGAGRNGGKRGSNSCLKMNFPELFPLSEETSAERFDGGGVNLEVSPQINSNNSSFNLDDPIKLYEQCRQITRQHRESHDETCKSSAPSICEYLRGLCRRGTTFCEQLLFCRFR